MTEHARAGETVTLLVDGEETEIQLEEGISKEEGDAFINSMLGIDPPDLPSEVDHPDFEFADIPMDEYPDPEGLRTVCRCEGCERTQVFDGLISIKDSGWTELGLPKGLLTDMTDLHYAFCPKHSLSEEEGYEPENDMGAHEFTGGVPTVVSRELDK